MNDFMKCFTEIYTMCFVFQAFNSFSSSKEEIQNEIFSAEDFKCDESNMVFYGIMDEFDEDGFPIIKNFPPNEKNNTIDKYIPVIAAMNSIENCSTAEMTDIDIRKSGENISTDKTVQRVKYTGKSKRTASKRKKDSCDHYYNLMINDKSIYDLDEVDFSLIDRIDFWTRVEYVDKGKIQSAKDDGTYLQGYDGYRTKINPKHLNIIFKDPIVYINIHAELLNPYERLSTQVWRILENLRFIGYINHWIKIPKSLQCKYFHLSRLELAFDIKGYAPYEVLRRKSFYTKYHDTIYSNERKMFKDKNQDSLFICYDRRKKLLEVEGIDIGDDRHRIEYKMTKKYLRSLKGLLGFQNPIQLLNRKPISVYTMMFKQIYRWNTRLFTPKDIKFDMKRIKEEAKPLWYLLSAMQFAQM